MPVNTKRLPAGVACNDAASRKSAPVSRNPLPTWPSTTIVAASPGASTMTAAVERSKTLYLTARFSASFASSLPIAAGSVPAARRTDRS